MSDIPTVRAIETVAIAMAAANGLRLDQMDPEERASIRRMANGALLRLALPDGPIPLAHLTATLGAIVQALRSAADAIDADPGHNVPEATLTALYARATDAEAISRVLRGLPEPEGEPEEAV